MKVILFTFAGRQDRMFILEKYVQKVLDTNVIDHNFPPVSLLFYFLRSESAKSQIFRSL